MAQPHSNKADWIERFASLAALTPELKTYLANNSTISRISTGTTIFGPGSKAENFLLLLSGTVRVQKTSANGREIVLYRLRSGESCVLTTACLLAQEDYLAAGITESDIEVVAVPRSVFDQLIATSALFRKFVFDAYSSRLTDLVMMIDEIAFSKIDIRLAQRLIKLSGSTGQVSMTHQALAQELGTAREVISRQLQEFQRRGWVTVTRGHVIINDIKALSELSRDS